MIIVQLLGQIIGFLILAAIVVFYLKHRGFHPEIFELQEGEEIVKMAKGDYWKVEFINETQNSGEFAFTNKRVLFKGTFFMSSDKNISIPYENIAKIEKAFVKVFPVAFKITTKDNQTYKFAIMKRQIYIDLITSLTQNSQN